MQEHEKIFMRALVKIGLQRKFLQRILNKQSLIERNVKCISSMFVRIRKCTILQR